MELFLTRNYRFNTLIFSVLALALTAAGSFYAGKQMTEEGFVLLDCMALGEPKMICLSHRSSKSDDELHPYAQRYWIAAPVDEEEGAFFDAACRMFAVNFPEGKGLILKWIQEERLGGLEWAECID